MYFKLIGREHYLKDIPKGKVNYTPARYFQSHQKTELIKYIRKHDEQLFFMINLVYLAALRPNEARTRKVGDIDFDRKLIFVDKNGAKTGKQRHAPICDALLPFLEQFKGVPSNILFHHPFF